MAYTQAQIDTLRDMLARGVKRGRMPNGEEVEFQTAADLRRQIADMEGEIAGVKSAFAVSYPTTGRGL